MEHQAHDRSPKALFKKTSPRQLALVEYNAKRHLAEQDETGEWRTISRHKELPPSITVIKVIAKY